MARANPDKNRSHHKESISAAIARPRASRSQRRQQESRRLIVLGAGLIVLTFLAYQSALNAGYIWDDDGWVYHNPTIAAADGLFRIWFKPPLGQTQYYPLLLSTWWVEHKLWGFDPYGYHFVNIVLHIANAGLLFALLRALRIPGALLAAAVFAVHPVHVESVAWVTERKNVLSGFFYLASLLSFVRFDRSRATPWYVASLGLYLCALLSKTVTCTLPVVLLLLWWLEKRTITRADVMRLVPFLLTGLALGLFTVWVEYGPVGARGPEWDLSMAQRIIIAARALWFYAGKLLWPVPLIFIYPRWEVDAADPWQWLWPVSAVGVAFLAWQLRDRWGRGFFVALTFFAVTLSPALGFVDIYPMRFSFVADHFQYLASIGLIALFAAVLSNVAERILPPRLTQTSWITAATIPLLVTLAWLTWRQGLAYKDTESIWSDTVRKNPSAWVAHNNLGDAWYEQRRFEEAMGAYKEALRLKPDLALVHSNVGNIYLSQGRTEEGLAAHRRALEIAPRNPNLLYNLGTAYLQSGMVDDAVRTLLDAVALKPDLGPAHYNLTVAYYKKGDFDRAIYHCDKALEFGYAVPATSLEMLRPYRKQSR